MTETDIAMELEILALSLDRMATLDQHHADAYAQGKTVAYHVAAYEIRSLRDTIVKRVVPDSYDDATIRVFPHMLQDEPPALTDEDYIRACSVSI